MLAEAKYPFAPLAVKVGTDIDLSAESPEWQEITAKNTKQLDGLWQVLEREARSVLEQVLGTVEPRFGVDEVPVVEVEVDQV